MKHFDAIVVGTGGIGSAALFHLASRGARVLGLDRFPVAHDRGSSHGHTRLIRLAYFEHPHYVPLLVRAYQLWRELEFAVDRSLLVETGLLMAGPASGDVLSGAMRSAALHSLPLEPLWPSEVVTRWPGLQLPEAWAAVYEACGGYLLVEECVRSHALAAERAGATFEHGVSVRGWNSPKDGRSVIVTTDRNTYAADQLILAPGAWASDLLQLPDVSLQVLRKSLFWYEPQPAWHTAYDAGNFPCFAFDAPNGFFYGFPRIDARGVKIAEHTGGRPLDDPLEIDRGIDAAEQDRVARVLTEHLPGISGHCTAHDACLYTMSVDRHFVVGRHPDHARVCCAAGFSGHGFKFASVIGEILADLATVGHTDMPIHLFSPGRFSRS